MKSRVLSVFPLALSTNEKRRLILIGELDESKILGCSCSQIQRWRSSCFESSYRVCLRLERKDGKSFIGVDGPFGELSRIWRVFTGEEHCWTRIDLKMVDGSTKKMKDYWWQTCRKGTRTLRLRT